MMALPHGNTAKKNRFKKKLTPETNCSNMYAYKTYVYFVQTLDMIDYSSILIYFVSAFPSCSCLA